MTNETDSFVQEVDESLRHERMLALAKRYGPWLIGAFVILILAVAGWQFWRDQQINAARSHSEDFIAAQQLAQQGEFAAAKTEFERLSNEGPRVYRVMAQMEHAAVLAEEGALEDALAGFDAAAEAARDPVMRQTAQMRAAYIAAEIHDFAAMRERLQPLAESDSRFAYLARELLAIEAWQAGELDLARETLQGLTLAFEAPDSVRERAQIALAVVGPGEETPADGAPTAPAPSEGDQ